MVYDDGIISISERELIVRQFYMPLGRARKIPLQKIRRVELHPLTIWNGLYRLWGMGVRPIWFHFDAGRLGKKHFLMVDTGAWMKIGLTPKDMDAAFRALRAKLVEKRATKRPLPAPAHGGEEE